MGISLRMIEITGPVGENIHDLFSGDHGAQGNHTAVQAFSQSQNVWNEIKMLKRKPFSRTPHTRHHFIRDE